ncbi:MAG TPA: hypothetical protein V6C72_15100, partial [Chroococcales cyanobacterium]
MPTLSPSQQKEYDRLLKQLPVGSSFIVWTYNGMGKTTLLEELHKNKGGELLSMRDYVDQLRLQDPFKMEETFEQMIMQALGRSDLVILDDLQLLYDVVCGCGYRDTYPRSGFVNAVLSNIVAYVASAGKKIVFGNEGKTPDPLADRVYYAGFQKFTVEDYEFLCRKWLDGNGAMDYAKIHRFAPKLNAHQLKSASLFLKETEDEVHTELFIEYLRTQRMASNVDLGEVEAVDLKSLRGIDDIIE